MPKLRRLSGKDIVKILEGLGFSVVRIRGSHHIMKRVVDGHTQTVNVPVHGNKDLGTGMLKRLYRDLQRYISEDGLKSHFYTD
ncbi:MAG: addiction module toxin, HicA family [Anaerolineaceae bacterium]|nr:MAG: addiction module toxin, HicA family [Anaerolineaceae bacterium]